MKRQQVVLDTARTRFLACGYVATTVESVAAAAGVSAATIYKSHGGKAGLVRTLCAQALGGTGPVPAEERSDALRSSSDPRALIEGWGRLVADVSPRVAPLTLVLHAAAESDAEAAALLDELEGKRLSRMADNARHLHDAGHLRAGVTADVARDVLWACSSPELFDLLAVRRGWTIAKYSRFVTDTMLGALL